MLLWAPESGAGSGSGGGSGSGSGGGASTPPPATPPATPPAGQDTTEQLSYETWVQAQPENVRGLLERHTSGLRSALESERGSRKDLERQLREMAGKAEKGSETQAQLTQMADRMNEADRRVDFYEEAHAAGVTNLKLAYLVAMQDEMFDKRGQVNFATMKAQYPELFGGGGGRLPAGNAGTGAGTPPQGRSMNEFIRASSGRR